MSIEMDEKIDYKYNEFNTLQELARYIENTYGEHYAQGKYQATEFIIDGGHGIGFSVGNILKYAQRYGHKGTPDDWRKDLMKVIHYAIIALYVHDSDHQKSLEDLSEQEIDLIKETQIKLAKQAKHKSILDARAAAEYLTTGKLDSVIKESRNPL